MSNIFSVGIFRQCSNMLEFMKSLKFCELTVADYLMRLSRKLNVIYELLLLLITQFQQFYRNFFLSEHWNTELAAAGMNRDCSRVSI